jgi:hypothetical protein
MFIETVVKRKPSQAPLGAAYLAVSWGRAMSFLWNLGQGREDVVT